MRYKTIAVTSYALDADAISQLGDNFLKNTDLDRSLSAGLNAIGIPFHQVFNDFITSLTDNGLATALPNETIRLNLDTQSLEKFSNLFSQFPSKNYLALAARMNLALLHQLPLKEPTLTCLHETLRPEPSYSLMMAQGIAWIPVIVQTATSYNSFVHERGHAWSHLIMGGRLIKPVLITSQEAFHVEKQSPLSLLRLLLCFPRSYFPCAQILNTWGVAGSVHLDYGDPKRDLVSSVSGPLAELGLGSLTNFAFEITGMSHKASAAQFINIFTLGGNSFLNLLPIPGQSVNTDGAQAAKMLQKLGYPYPTSLGFGIAMTSLALYIISNNLQSWATRARLDARQIGKEVPFSSHFPGSIDSAQVLEKLKIPVVSAGDRPLEMASALGRILWVVAPLLPELIKVTESSFLEKTAENAMGLTYTGLVADLMRDFFESERHAKATPPLPQQKPYTLAKALLSITCTFAAISADPLSLRALSIVALSLGRTLITKAQINLLQSEVKARLSAENSTTRPLPHTFSTEAHATAVSSEKYSTAEQALFLQYVEAPNLILFDTAAWTDTTFLKVLNLAIDSQAHFMADVLIDTAFLRWDFQSSEHIDPLKKIWAMAKPSRNATNALQIRIHSSNISTTDLEQDQKHTPQQNASTIDFLWCVGLVLATGLQAISTKPYLTSLDEAWTQGIRHYQSKATAFDNSHELPKDPSINPVQLALIQPTFFQDLLLTMCAAQILLSITAAHCPGKNSLSQAIRRAPLFTGSLITLCLGLREPWQQLEAMDTHIDYDNLGRNAILAQENLLGKDTSLPTAVDIDFEGIKAGISNAPQWPMFAVLATLYFLELFVTHASS